MHYSWDRVIRFLGEDNEVHYGEPILNDEAARTGILNEESLYAKVIEGDILEPSCYVTDEAVKVRAVLNLFRSQDVPMIRCVGLNYKAHAKEADVEVLPTMPITFIKAATSVAGWRKDISIPKIAQGDQADYEGELCFVIGRPGKDFKADKALEQHIAGFLVGNDVSTRKWQMDKQLSGPVPQFNFSKGFDEFAPLGPMLVSPRMVSDGCSLRLKTRVNGELRQQTNTSDFVSSPAKIVESMSQGTTLQKGCVVMTGTPSGAGFSYDPPRWLRDGDVVEVFIEKLGRIGNKVKYV